MSDLPSRGPASAANFLDRITASIRAALSAGASAAFPFETLEITALPKGGDRIVRLRTLQDLLEDFEDGPAAAECRSFLVHVRATPAEAAAGAPTAAGNAPNAGAAAEDPAPGDGMYLPNGKLNVPYLSRSADLLCQSGDYALARNVYQALRLCGECTPAALTGLARCAEAEGKSADALRHYEESLAYHPTWEGYKSLAQLLISQSRDQDAAEALERALNLKELGAGARFELHKACGNCWMRAKRPESAERHYLKALELSPGADEVRSNLGALFLQNGRHAEARRHFQDAVAANPRNAKAHLGLATSYQMEGDKRQAHDEYARALAIDLNNPTAIFHLVKCAYEIRSFAAAAALVEQYVQIAPVDKNLLYSLAGLQYHLGRVEEARDTCRRILEIVPDHAGARDLLNTIERYAPSAASDALPGAAPPSDPGRGSIATSME